MMVNREYNFDNQFFTKNYYLILIYLNRAAMVCPKVDLLHRPLVQLPPNHGFVNLAGIRMLKFWQDGKITGGIHTFL